MGHSNSKGVLTSSASFIKAVKSGDASTVTEALACKSKLLTASNTWSSQTAWHYAASKGHTKVLEAMASALRTNEDVMRNKHLSALGPSVEVILRKLVNQKDWKGRSALLLACLGGYAETVSYLLELGADPLLADNSGGRSALHYAASGGHVGCIGALLSHATQSRQPVHGRLVDICDGWGFTALHYAVWGRHPQAISALLSFDATLTMKSNRSSAMCEFIECEAGSTPLHLAAAKGDNNSITMLLAAYVERHATLFDTSWDTHMQPPRHATPRDPRRVNDAAGKLPYHVARQYFHRHVLEILHPHIPLNFVSPQQAIRLYGVPKLVVLAATALHKKLMSEINTAEHQALVERRKRLWDDKVRHAFGCDNSSMHPSAQSSNVLLQPLAPPSVVRRSSERTPPPPVVTGCWASTTGSPLLRPWPPPDDPPGLRRLSEGLVEGSGADASGQFSRAGIARALSPAELKRLQLGGTLQVEVDADAEVAMVKGSSRRHSHRSTSHSPHSPGKSPTEMTESVMECEVEDCLEVVLCSETDVQALCAKMRRMCLSCGVSSFPLERVSNALASIQRVASAGQGLNQTLTQQQLVEVLSQQRLSPHDPFAVPHGGLTRQSSGDNDRADPAEMVTSFHAPVSHESDSSGPHATTTSIVLQAGLQAVPAHSVLRSSLTNILDSLSPRHTSDGVDLHRPSPGMFRLGTDGCFNTTFSQVLSNLEAIAAANAATAAERRSFNGALTPTNTPSGHVRTSTHLPGSCNGSNGRLDNVLFGELHSGSDVSPAAATTLSSVMPPVVFGSVKMSTVQEAAHKLIRTLTSSRSSCSLMSEEDCAVCFDRPAALHMMTCMHRMCGECCRDLCKLHAVKPALCPFCRNIISGFVPYQHGNKSFYVS